MGYANKSWLVRLVFKIQLVKTSVFTEATVVKTTEAAASVASNVATAMGTGHIVLDGSQLPAKGAQ